MLPDLWKLIAGLGLFLYGMFHLEDSIKQVEGRTFKLFLRKNTKKKHGAILSGMFITGILQSSSIVNLLLLSFVGADLIAMRNAFGVLLGANVGGTFNSWIMAFGIKIDLGTYAYPVIALSAIGITIFKTKKRIYQFCRFSFGIGLIFLGLELMKTSMSFWLEQFDFVPYLKYSLFVFVLIGFVITAIIQTSAATVVLVLTALYANVIQIETGVAVVLGAELGTTLKILLGAIGGIPAKKRVAYFNSFFNIVTTTLGFVFIHQIIALITSFPILKDPMIVLIIFQTFINVIGVILFYFFLDKFADFFEKRFGGKDKKSTFFLQNIDPHVPEMATEFFEKEAGLLIHRSINLNLSALELSNKKLNGGIWETYNSKTWFTDTAVNEAEKYKLLKQSEGEILLRYAQISETEIEPKNLVRVNQILSSIRNAMSSVKALRDIEHNFLEFKNSGNDLKYELYILFRNQLENFYDELIPVFADAEKENKLDYLSSLLNKVLLDYKKLQENTYKHAGNKKLKEVELATVLNINHEIYISCKTITQAVFELYQKEI